MDTQVERSKILLTHFAKSFPRCKRRCAVPILLLLIACSLALGYPLGENHQSPEIQKRQQGRDPALKALLANAATYVLGYRKLCRDLVAEERMIQKEYDHKGKLKNERRFISDYLFVTVPSDPNWTVEFRDVVSIDGKAVRKNQELLELFRKRSSSAFEEARKVTRESTKYNLGRERISNMVNFCLSFLSPPFQRVIDYEFATLESPQESDRVVLQFRELTDQTALRAVTPYGKQPIYSQGRIWLSKPDSKVLKVDFTFKREDKTNPIAGRYLSEYKPGTDSLLLPSRFEEYFYDTKDPERLLFESVATYSNFRHFSVDIRILPDEPSNSSQ
jgi:hypothetical protein